MVHKHAREACSHQRGGSDDGRARHTAVEDDQVLHRVGDAETRGKSADEPPTQRPPPKKKDHDARQEKEQAAPCVDERRRTEVVLHQATAPPPSISWRISVARRAPRPSVSAKSARASSSLWVNRRSLYAIVTALRYADSALPEVRRVDFAGPLPFPERSIALWIGLAAK